MKDSFEVADSGEDQRGPDLLPNLHIQPHVSPKDALLFVAKKFFRNSLLETEHYGKKFFCLKILENKFLK